MAKQPATKQIGIYAFGTIVRQLVGFLMLPIYTRYLTPTDYGIVAMLTLMLSVFELVMGARFAQAIPKFYYERDAERERSAVVITALLVTISISLVGVIFIHIFSESLAGILLADTALWLYVSAFGLTLVTTAIESYGLIYLRLLDKPVLFVMFSLSKLFIALSLNVFLVIFLDLGVSGVVMSSVITSCIFAILAGVYIIAKTGIQFDGLLAKRLVIFSWPLWLAGGAAVYATFANRFMLRYFGDLADVGLYDLASRFGGLIVVLVWMPFNQWWQTERFSLLRSADKGRAVFREVFTLISAVLVIFAVGISMFSDVLIRVMAAPEFHRAGLAVTPLVFAVLIERLALFQHFSYFVSETTKYVAITKYSSAALLTIAYIAAIPVFGFVGAAYATLGVGICIFGLTCYLATSAFDTSIRIGPTIGFVGLGLIAVAIGEAALAHLTLLEAVGVKFLLMILLTSVLYVLLRLNSDTGAGLRRMEASVLTRWRAYRAG